MYAGLDESRMRVRTSPTCSMGQTAGELKEKPVRIDLDKAVDTVRELLDELEELNGTEPEEGPARKERQQRAEITRKALWLAHLSDRARVQIMDAYHDYKQQDMRSGGEPTSE